MASVGGSPGVEAACDRWEHGVRLRYYLICTAEDVFGGRLKSMADDNFSGSLSGRGIDNSSIGRGYAYGTA